MSKTLQSLEKIPKAPSWVQSCHLVTGSFSFLLPFPSRPESHVTQSTRLESGLASEGGEAQECQLSAVR